jgi:hypothetical protein
VKRAQQFFEENGMEIIRAVACLRRMRGGSQAYMIAASDDREYVVKLRGNPQGDRVLANELLATRLARMIGLAVPDSAIIEVDADFIRKHEELVFDLGTRRVAPEAGHQFGSRVVSNAVHVSEERKCGNRQAFAGMLAFDKWTSQMDGRQALYVPKGRKWTVTFIDFGYVFGALEWRLVDDCSLRGLMANHTFYGEIQGWDDFEPWLTNIEKLPMDAILQAGVAVPAEWYGGDREGLDALLSQLFERRTKVRGMLRRLIPERPQIFCNWVEGDPAGLAVAA